MQIEMYQHAFQISSIEVYCIWLERGLRRLRAIWIGTEGKCTTRLAFTMFSALDRCVGTVSSVLCPGLFWLKHFLNNVPVNCFTHQKSKVEGRSCLPHSIFISLADTLTTKFGPVNHLWYCSGLHWTTMTSLSIQTPPLICELSMNNRGPKSGWCCGSCHHMSKTYWVAFPDQSLRGRWGTGPGGCWEGRWSSHKSLYMVLWHVSVFIGTAPYTQL